MVPIHCLNLEPETQFKDELGSYKFSHTYKIINKPLFQPFLVLFGNFLLFLFLCGMQKEGRIDLIHLNLKLLQH
jgi:hypothetical protein